MTLLITINFIISYLVLLLILDTRKSIYKTDDKNLSKTITNFIFPLVVIIPFLNLIFLIAILEQLHEISFTNKFIYIKKYTGFSYIKKK